MQHHRTVLAVAVAVALFMLPVAVRAHAPDAYFAGAGTATIDGQLAPGEWDGAASQPLTIALPSGATTTGALFVMNDATTLYLAVRVDVPADEPPITIFNVAFEFDNDHSNDWPEPGDDVIGAGLRPPSDELTVLDNFRWPCPDTSSAFCGPLDSEWGGQNDVHAAIVETGVSIVAELAHPLDSGDSGHDFSLAPGDVVGSYVVVTVYGTGPDGAPNTWVDTYYPWPGGLGPPAADILVTRGVVMIDVAIGSGAQVPCVNNNGSGVIPITILGSASLDVTAIDPSTIRLETLTVKVVGQRSKLLVHHEDVNSDGIVDLIAQMQDSYGAFTTGQTTATVTGTLVDGTSLSGTAPICIAR